MIDVKVEVWLKPDLLEEAKSKKDTPKTKLPLNVLQGDQFEMVILNSSFVVVVVVVESCLNFFENLKVAMCVP